MKSTRLTLIVCLALALPLLTGCEKEKLMAPLEQIENGLSPWIPAPDQVNWNIEERMSHYGIHGVSFAVIQNNELVLAKTYGVTEAGGDALNEKSLFQISGGGRLATELAALRMVGEGKITLDAPINDVLTSWKLPDNEFTRETPVTLRLLLGHAEGINIQSFFGYEVDDVIPTLPQVLSGVAPANTSALEVVSKPGQASGNNGGFAIIQQALSDVSGLPFDQLLRETVLEPLGMSESTFEQPLPANRLAQAASGHYLRGAAVKGKGRIFPETAATGFWTTPTDTAKILIEFFRATQGKKAVFLSPEVEKDVLEDLAVQNNQGKMVRLGEIDPINEDDGFFAEINYAPFDGYGLVIATNGSDSRDFTSEVLRAVARAYEWPRYLRSEIRTIPMTDEQLDLFTGRYAAGESNTIIVTRGDGLLLTRAVINSLPEQLVPIMSDTFVNQTNNGRVTFRRERDGLASAYTFKNRNNQEVVLRRRPDGQFGARELVMDGKMDEGLAAYAELDSPPTQNALVTVGYALFNLGRSDDAIKILDLAVEFYPDSANVQDSRGEIFAILGEREKALDAFRLVEFLLLTDKSLPPGFKPFLEARARYYQARLAS